MSLSAMSNSRSPLFKVIALPLALLVFGVTPGCGGPAGGGKDKKGDKSSDEDDDTKSGEDKKGKEDGKSKDGKDGTDGSSTEPKAFGQECAKDEDCKSKICRELTFTNPVVDMQVTVKTCGSCREDKDCKDGNKGIACVPKAQPGGKNLVTAAYDCSDGSKGLSCEDAKQCKDGLKCASITLQGKKSDTKTCGECVSNDDCSQDTPICSTVGIKDFKPYNTCIKAGGKKDTDPCSGETEEGDRECENYCKSFGPLGSFCVQCREDSHCAMGETCSAPMLDPTNPLNSLPKCKAKDSGGSTDTMGDKSSGSATATGGSSSSG